ncbi:hypothetical protein THAOC_01861, partial [Thalassiosira oceanica]
AVAPRELVPHPELEISDVRHGFDVPAHNIEIRVIRVGPEEAPHEQATLVRLTCLIAPYFAAIFVLTLFAGKEFMNSPITRDLSNLNAAEAESATIAAEAEEEFGLVDEEDDTDDSSNQSLFEFIYGGILFVRPEIEGGNDLAATTPSCEEGEERYRYRAGTLQSESFHVVQTNQDLEVTLYLRALVIPNHPRDDDSYCDTGTWACSTNSTLLEWKSDLQFSVDASTVVSVRSRIGLDPDNKIDREVIALQKIDVDNSNFTKCVIQPCLLDLDNAFLMGEDGQITSRATVLLKAGIPSFDNSDIDWPRQHAKQVLVSQLVSEAEMLVHTMHVVIRGQFAEGGGRGLSIPLQTPMLIIRDPPGGHSSVTYSRVQTTVTISMEELSVYK